MFHENKKHVSKYEREVEKAGNPLKGNLCFINNK
jgi:hypothetical protein